MSKGPLRIKLLLVRPDEPRWNFVLFDTDTGRCVHSSMMDTKDVQWLGNDWTKKVGEILANEQNPPAAA